MTKNRFILIGLVVAIGVLAGWWLLRPRPVIVQPVAQVESGSDQKPSQKQETTAPQPLHNESASSEVMQQKIEEGRRGQIAQMMEYAAAFNTPINFWGKVVDEKGAPISGALAKMGAADQPLKTGTQYKRVTDANGLFAVTDAKGLSISVNVSKEGYYQTDRSRGQLSYHYPSGNKMALPTPNDPAVFVLRKMGETESLIYRPERAVRLPKNGNPVEINLETGSTIGKGDLKVQCWTNDQSKNERGEYDWKCVLTVPRGGLVERTDAFAFVAPEDGYQESIELLPSSEKWSAHVERQFFLKLSDSRYARIIFDMRTGSEHFFVIESYFNPTPGSRNLEFDPAKAIKP
jgi:hypothetical protein